MPEYPAHLARERQLADGRKVLIRPVRPEDEAGLRAFFAALSPDALHCRFMKYVAALNDKLLHFFTHVDYAQHMAFVCEAGGRLVGEARYVANPGAKSCEFAVVIADDWHRSGIAGLLMDALVRAARDRGFESMEGLVLRDNRPMRRFVRALGFEVSPVPEDSLNVRAVKALR